jgi:hypothetical protein
MAVTKRLHSAFIKGLAATRDLADRAGKKLNDTATKGALRLEGAQLKSRANKLHAKLGKEVYLRLVDMNKSTVSRENSLISELLDEIKGLRSKIELKEEEYRAIGETVAAKA